MLYTIYEPYTINASGLPEHGILIRLRMSTNRDRGASRSDSGPSTKGRPLVQYTYSGRLVFLTSPRVLCATSPVVQANAGSTAILIL